LKPSLKHDKQKPTPEIGARDEQYQPMDESLAAEERLAAEGTSRGGDKLGDDVFLDIKGKLAVGIILLGIVQFRFK
jgi:hypothetical protein